MGDSENILYTSPVGEHITARRSTRTKFLQLETVQLKAYITDLESSIGTSKHLLRELAISIKSDFLIDKAFTAKMIKDLESENLALEDRIRRVTIEKNDACLKAQSSDRAVRDILLRERTGGHPLESQMKVRRSTLEEKEGKVQTLDLHCKQLLEEIEDHDRQREIAATNEKESSTRMAEKYVRLKEIHEKLQREMQKVQDSSFDLEENCKLLLSDLRKVNAVLRNPVTRSERIEEFLNQTEQVGERSDAMDSDSRDGDLLSKEFLLRQLEVLHTQQRSKTLSQKVSLAITDFNSQVEQKYVLYRLTAEVSKFSDKIKDLQLKRETLVDELRTTRRLHASLQQDNFRISSALDTLRHKVRSLEGVAPVASKSICPRSQRSTSLRPSKARKKKRASSNPLEYMDEPESVAAPLTTRGPRREVEAEESIEQIELSPEMPSIIKRVDGDEFLQGDSFLVDALHLRNK